MPKIITIAENRNKVISFEKLSMRINKAGTGGLEFPTVDFKLFVEGKPTGVIRCPRSLQDELQGQANYSSLGSYLGVGVGEGSTKPFITKADESDPAKAFDKVFAAVTGFKVIKISDDKYWFPKTPGLWNTGTAGYYPIGNLTPIVENYNSKEEAMSFISKHEAETIIKDGEDSEVGGWVWTTKQDSNGDWWSNHLPELKYQNGADVRVVLKWGEGNDRPESFYQYDKSRGPSSWNALEPGNAQRLAKITVDHGVAGSGPLVRQNRNEPNEETDKAYELRMLRSWNDVLKSKFSDFVKNPITGLNENISRVISVSRWEKLAGIIKN